MMYKSLREEWPYHCEVVWLRWTTDGVTYHEEQVSEAKIGEIQALDIPEWRPIDPPEWAEEHEKQAMIDRRRSDV